MHNKIPSSSKNKTLQGLRGYGFSLIFISHCNVCINQYGANVFTWLGAIGVSIFFDTQWISIVEWLCVRNKALGTIAERIKKRVIKVYPLHIITLLLSLLLMYKSLLSVDWLKPVIIATLNALLLHGYVPESSVYFSYNAVSWYLCVLMFCAIISPMVLKLCLRLREKYIGIGLSVLVLIEFILYFIFRQVEFAHWILYIIPLVRSIDFTLGG